MSIENLTGLNILVVSPNEWGDMRVSKHNYAETLARRGNRVFFLNPPASKTRDRLVIEDVEDIPNLATVTYRPFVPYSLRFHSRGLFNAIARKHVAWLLKRIDVHFDVVWCFDLNLYSDLRWFEAPLKIFHPVDQVLLPHQIDMATHADLVFSVSDEILGSLREHRVPKLRIEHGVSAAFVSLAERRLLVREYVANRPIKVGYVGNLLMPYIDREAMLEVIERHPEIEFHLWGPREPKESNVGANEEGSSFICRLILQQNVILHGPKTPSEIAEKIGDVDVFLMCYSISRDPNRGCNSHKILEYMSTGRVIVANHVSDYAEQHSLIEMMPADGSRTLLEVFDMVIENIESHNAVDNRSRRLHRALDNSYPNQIDRIAAFRNSIAIATAASVSNGVRVEA